MPKSDNNNPIDKVINAMDNPELRQQYLSELGINNNKNGCTYIKHYSHKHKQRPKKDETLQKKATSNQQTQESADAANSNPQESQKTIESVSSPRR